MVQDCWIAHHWNYHISHQVPYHISINGAGFLPSTVSSYPGDEQVLWVLYRGWTQGILFNQKISQVEKLSWEKQVKLLRNSTGHWLLRGSLTTTGATEIIHLGLYKVRTPKPIQNLRGLDPFKQKACKSPYMSELLWITSPSTTLCWWIHLCLQGEVVDNSDIDVAWPVIEKLRYCWWVDQLFQRAPVGMAKWYISLKVDFRWSIGPPITMEMENGSLQY